MGLILPYSFTGGTSAKAQEVNANFIAVQSFVDNLETVTNGFINRYNLLDSGKANVNGSENQQFAVAPATNDNQAVTLAQMNDAMLPFITLISGLKLTRVTDYIFSCGIGGCYDSLYKYPILNTTQVTFDTQGSALANQDPYVWILARASNPRNVTLAITYPSQTPTLIYDDTIYRKIGTVVLGTNGYINTIYND